MQTQNIPHYIAHTRSILPYQHVHLPTANNTNTKYSRRHPGKPIDIALHQQQHSPTTRKKKPQTTPDEVIANRSILYRTKTTPADSEKHEQNINAPDKVIANRSILHFTKNNTRRQKKHYPKILLTRVSPTDRYCTAPKNSTRRQNKTPTLLLIVIGIIKNYQMI